MIWDGSKTIKHVDYFYETSGLQRRTDWLYTPARRRVLMGDGHSPASCSVIWSATGFK